MSSELQSLVISGDLTKRKSLGTGSYGTVDEYEVDGISCAGKRIHDVLVESGPPNTLQRYVEECKIMSRLRHPNIAQFLGLQNPPDSAIPVLMMERLAIDLDSLLENFKNPPIPLSLRVSFLTDVARGLAYLHGHKPAIIHRDLSAKNVLLNSSLVAKISDLGNSRIVHLSPHQVAKLSKNPGCALYMPPEISESPTCYGPSLDVFSFGHLGLFTATQAFPNDLLASKYTDSGCVLARTEVQRRSRYLPVLYKELGEDHHLVGMIKACLDDDPLQRPTAEELVVQLEELGHRPEFESFQDYTLQLQLMKQLKDIEESHWREELDSVHSEKCHLESQLHERDETIEEMCQQEEISQAQIYEKDVTIREVQQQLEDTQTQLNDRDVTIQDVHQQLENVQREGEQLAMQKEADIQSLQSQLRAKGRELEEMEGENSMLSAENRALHSQLRERDDYIKQLQQELKDIHRSKELTLLAFKPKPPAVRKLDPSIPRSSEPCMITCNREGNVRMPCGHTISPEGLMYHCWSEISLQKHEICCCVCNQEWPLSIIVRYSGASEEECSMLEAKLSQNYCQKSSEITVCPECGSYCQRMNSENNCVQCQVCTHKKKKKKDFRFCLSCNQPWEPNARRCSNADCSTASLVKRLKEAPLVSIAHIKFKVPALRACPSCGSLIEYDTYKHVSCTKCSVNFCFVCLGIETNGSWMCGSLKTECTPAPRQLHVPRPR